MKTRKSFQWLMLAACLFVMGTTHVMASNDDKEEGSTTSSSNQPLIMGGKIKEGDYRSPIFVPFAAHYQRGVIYITTTAEFSMISLNVVNETTGQMWNTTTDISDGMGEISIVNGGAGNYTVEIVTEFGECFVGRFTL